MALSNKQLQAVLKAITTTGAGGQLSDTELQAFIDLAVEQNAVLGRLRMETDLRSRLRLDNLSFLHPVMGPAVEATAPPDAAIVKPTITPRFLDVKEVISGFDLTYSFLRRNIEGDNVDESISRIFSKRWGKDKVLACFTGNTATAISAAEGTPEWFMQRALSVCDGYLTRAAADADTHDVAFDAGDSVLDVIFPALIDALPQDYVDQTDDLAFYVSPKMRRQYGRELMQRGTALGDSVISGSGTLSYDGIEIVPVYGFPTTKAMLTFDENLCVGMGPDAETEPDRKPRKRVVEMTFTEEFDANYAVSDAVAVATQSV